MSAFRFSPNVTLLRLAGLALAVLLFSAPASGQRFLSDYDSTLFLKDTVVRVVSRFENLHLSGYIQPQYQVAGSEGAPSYEGGNFSEHSSSRFLLRRARIKVDYQLPARGKPLPLALFTFQFDVTERGSIARDMFAKFYLPRNQAFSLTAGLFARPFGYEVNLSSAFRESPERARASQVLMPGERDLGAMITFDPVERRRGAAALKLDVGMFNGPGVTGTTDFDSFKDLAARLTLKPYGFGGAWSIGGGLSALYGGWRQDARYRLEWARSSGNFEVDSSEANVGRKAPRHYYGADLQLAVRHGWGKTEFRAEYWTGTQPGTDITTANPGTQPQGPTYLRSFDAAIFYLLQNIGNEKWELGLKYDWYDPNRFTGSMAIGAPGRNLTVADIRFDIWSAGLTWYAHEKIKLLGWFSKVRNERTALAGYERDRSDDVFTLRTQFRF